MHETHFINLYSKLQRNAKKTIHSYDLKVNFFFSYQTKKKILFFCVFFLPLLFLLNIL